MRLLSKLLLLATILIVIDTSFGLLFSKLLKKQTDGRFFKIAYILDKSNEDIIIIGSSRAETNYNPSIFAKELGMTCWNAGRGGQGLLYFLSIEKEILKRYSPKLIIVNLDQTALEGSIDYDKSAILRPFTNHSAIYELMSQKDWTEKYKLLSNIYKYNSLMFYFFRPFFIKNKDGSAEDRGWKPRKGEVPVSIISKINIPLIEVPKNELNPCKIEMLNEMIELANKKQTKIIISFSPDFFSNRIETNTIAYIKELSKQQEFEYFDFSTDPALVENQKYFCDLYHMNDAGANLLSSLLAFKISESLLKNY